MMAQAGVVVLILTSVLVAAATPAQAGPVAVNKAHSNFQNFALPHRVLGIRGSDWYHGEAAQYDAANSYYSAFRVQDHPGTGHTIQEVYGQGRCLDSNHIGEAYGRACNGGWHQRWDFNHLGTQWDSFYNRQWDVYEITNKATGQCLDANFTWGYTRPCNGGSWQRWFMIDTDH